MMALRCFTYAADGELQPGLAFGDAAVDLRRGLAALAVADGRWRRPLPATMAGLLAWDLETGVCSAVAEFIDRHQLAEYLQVPADARRRAPIPDPPKVLAVTRTYRALAQSTRYAVADEPIFFAKARTSVIGPYEPIVCHAGAGRIEYEGELAVVMGRGGYRIPESAALGYVAAYCPGNDVTARELQARDMDQTKPYYRSKSMNGFCPLGPDLVLARAVADPQALGLTTRVNGVVKQQANTAEMQFTLAQMIAHISRFITLEPGDVILSGTPAGIGPLRPGDLVEVDIPGLGILPNPVIAASTDA